jgi:hypothetical protein
LYRDSAEFGSARNADSKAVIAQRRFPCCANQAPVRFAV